MPPMPDTAAEIVVTTDDPVVARVVRRVVEEVRPIRVVLFGSRATGTARPDSDVDLLVVMPDGTDRRAVLDRLYRGLWDVGVPVDYLASTPSALDLSQHRPGLIYGTVLQTGHDVYVTS